MAVRPVTAGADRSAAASLTAARTGSGGRGGLDHALVVQQAPGQCAERPADQGEDDEHPELLEGPPALVDGDGEAAGRVHRRVVHRDADEVDERQRQADRDPGEPDRELAVERAADDEHEDAGQNDLDEDRGDELEARRGVRAVPVRREAAGHDGGPRSTCLAEGDGVEDAASDDAADDLTDEVVERVGGLGNW